VHENNVIHRDIKLRNIMRRREDGKIVLIDFGAVKEIKGLAKNEQGDVNSTLIIGTPGYMPDEQANGKPRLCSDVYAVGMLGIQALTGISPRELPFNPNNGELIWRDSAKISERLAEILTGMVRHHFSQRYQTAAEALMALKSPILIAPNTSSAYQAPPVTLPSTFRQPRPVALQTLGLVGLMGVGFGLGVFGWNMLQSSSIGNEPIKTTEIPPTIQKIDPSVKPENIKLNPLPTPPATRRDSGANYPFPFRFFLGDINSINKTSVNKENSQPKDKSNKVKQPALESQPKPIREKNPPAPIPVIKEKIKEKIKEESSSFVTPKPQRQESLPSIAIPQSEDKETDNSEKSIKSIIPTPVEVPSSSSSELQKDKNEDIELTKPITEPTAKPTTEPTIEPTTEPTTSLPNESDSVNNEIAPEEENNKPLSKPENLDSAEQTTENSTTSKPSDKDKEEDKLSSEQPVQTPPSPDTPAIESESESPQPTPSPIQTSDTSVVVPTAKPLLEDKNFFYTVPTSPTPIPEAESQPTLSPQPTPTSEAETQSVATPEPNITPEAEVEKSVAIPQSTPTSETEKPNKTPQPTPSPEIENQPTPQASTTPEAQTNPTPTELPTIPEVYASPSPEPEIQITPPRISASPSASEILKIPQAATPTPSPTQTPGLSLKRFAI
ncbi:MAG: hypothetical protein AAF630_10000, partial [Cyanobacteria bacterium P01_C01_bin.38]